MKLYVFHILFIIILIFVAFYVQVNKEKYINYECEEIEPSDPADPIDCKGKGTLEKVIVEKKKGKNGGLPNVKVKYRCCYPEKNQICINDSCIKEESWKMLALINTKSIEDDIIKLKKQLSALQASGSTGASTSDAKT